MPDDKTNEQDAHPFISFDVLANDGAELGNVRLPQPATERDALETYARLKQAEESVQEWLVESLSESLSEHKTLSRMISVYMGGEILRVYLNKLQGEVYERGAEALTPGAPHLRLEKQEDGEGYAVHFEEEALDFERIAGRLEKIISETLENEDIGSWPRWARWLSTHVVYWLQLDMERELGDALDQMTDDEWHEAFTERFHSKDSGELWQDAYEILARELADIFQAAADVPNLSLFELEELMGLQRDDRIEVPAPSSSPFDKKGLAGIPTDNMNFALSQALLKAHRGPQHRRPQGQHLDEWHEDDLGRPRYVHKLKKPYSGMVAFAVELPGVGSSDVVGEVQKELQWQILQSMGPDTAWLHFLIGAYASALPRRGRPDQLFRIPRKEVYRCLGLHRNKHLTREEKDERVREEVRRLKAIHTQFHQIAVNGDKVDWHALLEPSPLWNIDLHGFGQISFDEDGQTRHSDWQLVGREGTWAQLFLHGQTNHIGYFPREIFENIDRRSPIAQRLVINLVFQSRFAPGQPVEARIETLMRWCEIPEPTNRNEQYDTKNRLLNAIEEQERFGFTPDYSEMPTVYRPGAKADLQPGYWEEMKGCKVRFIPRKALMLANARGGGKQIQKLPAPTTGKGHAWTPTRIKELRKALGLNQKAMAEEIGVSQGQVSHLETGRRSPSSEQRKVLTKLAKRMGL